MAFKGARRPLLDFISGRMKESLALCDLITGEKTALTFLNIYLVLIFSGHEMVYKEEVGVK